MSIKRNQKILFTSGLGITDRPYRWKTITNKFFVPLAESFTEMGCECSFYTNPLAQLDIHKWNCTGFGTAWYQEILTRNIGDFDIIFIWNGNSPSDEVVAKIAREAGVQTVFGELGWFTQKTTLQFDPKGTGPRSSLRDLDLMSMEAHPGLSDFIKTMEDTVSSMRTRPRDYLFVPLQDEKDTNVTRHSPFKTMFEFVKEVKRLFPERNIVLRHHPRYQAPGVHTLVDDRVMVAEEGHLYEWLRGAAGVVGINSTVLFEALLFGKPVIAFGESAATGLGVFSETGTHRHAATTYSMSQAFRICNLLSEMIFKRSFSRDKLGDTEYTANYPLFKRLLAEKEVPV